MLVPGIWTLSEVLDGRMELTLHCNSSVRGNCAKVFNLPAAPSDAHELYDPERDIFIWQSQQLAEFNGNPSQN